jgi:putative transposase
MANYRRNFLPGGSSFFTVNLDNHRCALLTEHVVLLWAAFWQVRARHPFAYPLDWAGDPGDQARSFGEK